MIADRIFAVVVCFVVVLGRAEAQEAEAPRDEFDVVKTAEALMSRSGTSEALSDFEAAWKPSFVPMLVDALRVVGLGPQGDKIATTLNRRTGQRFGIDVSAWFDWIWKQKIVPHPRYADVKSTLYGRIDPRFARYFDSARTTRIRLDEVRWGGVVQDGIPPLRNPAMLSVGKAKYLADTDVVFGIEINGDVRAYPKRILAWHEMFTDKVGGVHVTGVY